MMEVRNKYIDLLMRAVLCSMYPDPALAYGSDDKNHRKECRDWPSIAHSMIGEYRAKNIVDLCNRLSSKRVGED